MVELLRPHSSSREAWLAMAAEFGGEHIDGSAMDRRTVDELRDPEAFEAWIREQEAHERGEGVPEGWVSSSLRWIAQGDEIVGTIHLRHELNEFLLRDGGHIGYAVRPTARRRGVASRALAVMLEECRERGINPVLLTCDDGNVASARTIEANGGVLEDVRDGGRRYWITTSGG
jgi:predicted acetyltransferase